MNYKKTSKYFEVSIPSKKKDKIRFFDYLIAPFAHLSNKILLSIYNWFNTFGEIAALFIFSMLTFFKKWRVGKPLIRDILVKQVFYAGFGGIVVIGIVSFIMGGLIIMIFTTVDIPFMNMMAPKNEVISMVLIQGMIQHLGPLLTAIIVIGRSGTAISTEIGNMRVNHETEALENCGIDLLHFLIAPRIVGMIISNFALTLYFAIIGVVGGVLIAIVMVDDFILSEFIPAFFQTLQIAPVAEAILKAIGCGAASATLACYYGLQVRQSYVEVPRATTQAVVKGIILTFILFGYVSFLFIMIK